MTGPHLVSAGMVPVETGWRAFVDGFQEYVVPVQLTLQQFEQMVANQSVVSNASIIALMDSSEPVGIALLAIRGHLGWCAGLAVVPAWRGRGLGRDLMAALLRSAREYGLDHVRLECIDGNHAARALYDRLGFRPLRRLDMFHGRADRTAGRQPRSSQVGRFADPRLVWERFAAYHHEAPPWQGAVEALQVSHAAAPLHGFYLGPSSDPAAYLLVRDAGASVQIVDGGVQSRDSSAETMMRSLVAELLAVMPNREIVAQNVPAADPLNAALRTCGIPVHLTQTEMAIDLAIGADHSFGG